MKSIYNLMNISLKVISLQQAKYNLINYIRQLIIKLPC